MKCTNNKDLTLTYRCTLCPTIYPHCDYHPHPTWHLSSIPCRWKADQALQIILLSLEIHHFVFVFSHKNHKETNELDHS